MKYLQSSGLIISIILFISLPGQDTEQKVDCKVLKAEISGQYTGECKKDLAHGFGKAVGKDTYEGQFRRGLPHGKGIYTFASGAVFTGRWKKGLRNGRGTLLISVEGKDSVIVGVWKDDEFVKTSVVDDKFSYNIVYRRSVDRIRILPMGTKNEISIKIERFGMPLQARDLLLYGSSGNQVISHYFTGFQDVEFPFRATVTYLVPNKLMTGVLNCEVRFEIYRPGGWEVILQH